MKFYFYFSPPDQLALFKQPAQQLIYLPPQSSTPILQTSSNQLGQSFAAAAAANNYPQQQTTQSSLDTDASKIISRLDQLNEKIDTIKSQTQINNQNLPSMETNVILQNIQRIVKENEQYKRDLYDKSAKIEELNSKITDLLNKAQTYAEQKHQLIEEKNLKFQSNIESNINRVYELEKDKLKLTNELSELTAKLSDYNLEVNRIRSSEQQMKEKTLEMSKTVDSVKQNQERLLVENAELQTKLDKALNDLKTDKTSRKQADKYVYERDEEILELNANLKDLASLENQLDDMKKSHSNELKQLNEKLSKMRSNASESLSEQLKQIESDLNRDWQTKLDQQLEQAELKFQRKLEQLTEEKNAIELKSTEYKEQVKNLKNSLNSKEVDAEKLGEKIEELTIFKNMNVFSNKRWP